MNLNSHFEKFSIDQGIDMDFFDQSFLCQIRSWSGGSLELSVGNAYYGFVFEGPTILKTTKGSFELQTGMFFSISDCAYIIGGRGLVYVRKNFACSFSFGGEKGVPGQLRYIGGSTASVLIHPEIRGFPILNLLCIPPRTNQAMHVHPDIRLGFVYKGLGYCFIPNIDGRVGLEFEQRIPLRPGDIFHIPRDGKHRFFTESEHLVLVPWHAHSNDGVNDDQHYMLDRSIVLSGATGNQSWLTENAISGKELRQFD
jgi:quercetin dioxygenase-like cupin family protein